MTRTATLDKDSFLREKSKLAIVNITGTHKNQISINPNVSGDSFKDQKVTLLQQSPTHEASEHV